MNNLEQNISLAIDATSRFSDAASPIIEKFGVVFSPIIVALIASRFAFNNLLKKQHIDIEIDKINTINECGLKISRALKRLKTIRVKYCNDVVSKEKTCFRAILIRKFEVNDVEVDFDFWKLSFLSTNLEDKSLSIGKDEFFDDNYKYLNVDFIDMTFTNYQFLLKMWQKRNDILQEIHDCISSDLDQSNKRVQSASRIIEKEFGISKYYAFIALTEDLIQLTDQCIKDFHHILKYLPTVSKEHVNLKLVGDKAKLLGYHYTKKHLDEYLSPTERYKVDLSNGYKFYYGCGYNLSYNPLIFNSFKF